MSSIIEDHHLILNFYEKEPFFDPSAIFYYSNRVGHTIRQSAMLEKWSFSDRVYNSAFCSPFRISSIFFFNSIMNNESCVDLKPSRGSQTDHHLFDWEKNEYVILPIQEYIKQAEYYYGHASDVSADKVPKYFKGKWQAF